MRKTLTDSQRSAKVLVETGEGARLRKPNYVE